MKIIHVGDLGVMIPAAAAIIACFAISRAWRMAWCWCLLFGVCIGVVAASKIAFLGWGYGVRTLGFNAISGHATCATAVIPVVFYLVLQRASPAMRAFGVIAGLICGVVVGILLVILNEHSASEAISGCLVGATASSFFILNAKPLALFGEKPWLLPIILVFFLLLWKLAQPPIESWMMQVALHLSGHDVPYTWIK